MKRVLAILVIGALVVSGVVAYRHWHARTHTTTTAVSTTSSSTSTTLGAACGASHFTATLQSLGAAAGTTYASVTLVNTGSMCHYSGAPSVTFAGASGVVPLTVTVADASFSAVGSNAPPVPPQPGDIDTQGSLTFDLGYNSAVSSGSCSSIATMTVTFGGSSTSALSLFGSSFMPCGTVLVSSLFAAG